MKGPETEQEGGRYRSKFSTHHCSNLETHHGFAWSMFSSHTPRGRAPCPGAAGLLVPLLCTTLAANMRVQAWQESSSWADIEPSL